MGMFSKFFLVSVAAYAFSSFSFLIFIFSFAGSNVMPFSFGSSNTISFPVHLKMNCARFTLSTSFSSRYVKLIMLLNSFRHVSPLTFTFDCSFSRGKFFHDTLFCRSYFTFCGFNLLDIVTCMF